MTGLKYVGDFTISYIKARAPISGKLGMRVMASADGRIYFHEWAPTYQAGLDWLKATIEYSGLSANLLRDTAGAAPKYLWDCVIPLHIEFLGHASGFDYYIDPIECMMIAKGGDDAANVDVMTIGMALKISQAPGNDHVKIGYLMVCKWDAKRIKAGT